MITVYEFERKDGLSDIITNSTSIALSSVAKVDVNPIVKVIANANPDQIDLFYLKSVLVSLGWNKNDDVFTKEYVWAARKTPVDKQFNFMHNEKDIIGHITSSEVYSNDKLILDDTKIDDLPDEFDIIVGSVLYKHWSDETLKNRMEKLIAEIQEGKWRVSMECLFSNFDYAVVSPDGEQKVIARTAETSFLTKYLRAYKGTGSFNGYKVGRLLKNFAFSGEGLVDNPANPKSVIINSGFTGVNASVDFINGELSMSEKTISLEEYNALKDELKEAKANIKASNDKEVTEYKNVVAKLEQEKKDLQTQLENAQSLSKEKDVKIKDVEDKLIVANESLNKINTELETIKAEKIKANRVSKLLEVNVAKDKAEQLVQKFATASDEMFDEVVALNKTKKEETKAETKVENKEIKTDLDSAKADDALNLSQKTEDKDQLIRSAASSWIQENMLTKQEKK